MSRPKWSGLVLAAGRGPEDAMAKAYGVANKSVIEVGGIPMLARVVAALAGSGLILAPVVAIEDRAIAVSVLGETVSTITAEESAPASAIAAVARGTVTYPVLVTTGDHALLTADMVRHFCQSTEHAGADFTVGLARAETIFAAYPSAQRTFFHLGSSRVSGCNLFALNNARGLRLLEHWQFLEQARKKPWRLVSAFGPFALLRYLTGWISLDSAFEIVSRRFGITVKYVLMPQAEAAIDIDKPADKNLAEHILALRPTSRVAHGEA